MAYKKFIGNAAILLLLFCMLNTLHCGGGGGSDYDFAGHNTNETSPQIGETTPYLQQSISSDKDPSSMNKGDVSIITGRRLMALTDENGPAFREAFSRGAVFTLTYPGQAEINKLRQLLSLDARQVISEDAQDQHAEIYALTSRNNGGGMTYEYVAISPANISLDLSSYDVTRELEERGLIGLRSEDSSFDATAVYEDETTSEDFARLRAERFLEWTRGIDSLHTSNVLSAREKRAEIEGAYTEEDFFGESIRIDGSRRHSIIMSPEYRVFTWHSFKEKADFYYIKLSGLFSPATGQYKKGWNYVRGYASWYDLATWFENASSSQVALNQHSPENYSDEITYTSSKGVNLNGKVAFDLSHGKSLDIKPEISIGGNFSETETYKGYDYDIEDASASVREGVRWIVRFKHPKDTSTTPNRTSRTTFTPHFEGVWRVKEDYWKQKKARPYYLYFTHKGALGERNWWGTSEYGRTSLVSYITLNNPPHLAVNTYYLDFPASGGTKTINVNSDERWGYSSHERLYDNRGKYTYANALRTLWLTVGNANERSNEPTGEQARTLRITVPRYTRYNFRETELWIFGWDTGEMHKVIIRQSAY